MRDTKKKYLLLNIEGTMEVQIRIKLFYINLSLLIQILSENKCIALTPCCISVSSLPTA